MPGPLLFSGQVQNGHDQIDEFDADKWHNNTAQPID